MGFIKIEFGIVDPAENEVVVAVGGDILIKSNIARIVLENNRDYLFSGLRPILKKANVIFANLETPITTSNKKNNDKDPSLPFLKIIPEIAEAFSEAPIHVLGLANNHILDYGIEGLKETIMNLEKLRISYVGAGMGLEESRKLVIKEAGNKKVGFLAYSNNNYADRDRPGCAPIREDIILKDLKRYRDNCDFLIVSLHLGIVYSNYPLMEHMNLARKIIDNGADIVIGHHPHVFQGMEIYNGGIIMYSLGSLIYDLTNDEDKNAIVNCTLYKEGLCDSSNDHMRLREGILALFGFLENRLTIELIPVFQDNLEIPRVPDDERAEKILDRFYRLLNDLSNPNLPERKVLKKLSSIENIQGLYDVGVKGILKRIHRIRLKHINYAYRYTLSKFQKD